MKLEEAEKYICPQSRARDADTGCAGNACAAWRWAEPKFGSVDRRRGYCGLAGEPKYPLNPENEL